MPDDPTAPDKAATEHLFDGYEGRECGEHRTLGDRAWCHDCSEYCYPDGGGCRGCEAPQRSAEIARLRAALRAMARRSVAQKKWRANAAKILDRAFSSQRSTLRRLGDALGTPLWDLPLDTPDKLVEIASELRADRDGLRSELAREREALRTAYEFTDAMLEQRPTGGQVLGLRGVLASALDMDTTRPRPERAMSFQDSMGLIERRYGDTIRSEAFDDEPSAEAPGVDQAEVHDDHCERMPPGVWAFCLCATRADPDVESWSYSDRKGFRVKRKPPAGAHGPNPRAEAARRLRAAGNVIPGGWWQEAAADMAHWLERGPSEQRDAVARALLGMES